MYILRFSFLGLELEAKISQRFFASFGGNIREYSGGAGGFYCVNRQSGSNGS